MGPKVPGSNPCSVLSTATAHNSEGRPGPTAEPSHVVACPRHTFVLLQDTAGSTSLPPAPPRARGPPRARRGGGALPPPWMQRAVTLTVRPSTPPPARTTSWALWSPISVRSPGSAPMPERCARGGLAMVVRVRGCVGAMVKCQRFWSLLAQTTHSPMPPSPPSAGGPPAQFQVDFSRVRGRGQGVSGDKFTAIRSVQIKQITALVCLNVWVGLDLIRSGDMGHQVRTNLPSARFYSLLYVKGSGWLFVGPGLCFAAG